MIPVQRPYLGREELEALAGVFDTRWLGMGSVTAEFEEKLKEYLGVKHAIAVNSGTSALHIALDALDLCEDDEVVVPSFTFVASVQAIISTGARPVFCDVRSDDLNIDVEDVLGRFTERTRAVMPVHFGGVSCDIDVLSSAAEDRNIRIVEDAAHAFGSTYKGRKVGTLGDITCFSFDPVKNITCGEGGAVVTNDDEIAARIIPKRILGIDNDTWSRMREKRNWFYRVVTRGYRYHMSNLNAGIGLEQLKRLESFKLRKQAIVRRYDEAFGNVRGLVLPLRNLEETFPFFYTIRVPDNRRDDLMKYLREKDIRTGVHYIPNHTQPLFADYRVPLPVTEQVYEEIVTLPLYYEMSDNDVERVIEEVCSFLA